MCTPSGARRVKDNEDMSPTAARLGICLFVSVLAVAAIAGSLALARRSPARDIEHACWGASAG